MTRLYKIAEIPPSVYWDEASIGINAYSIVQTGKDEWGRSFPLDFEAFGEYKLPIYIYTTALAVKAFGLNAFAVRFPAVIFSLGVVILSFLLSKQLTKDERVGFLTAFFVSISQWFFIISRTGFEATAGLFFFMVGIYFFIAAMEGKKYFLIPAIAGFILTLYSYNSFLLITPITLLVLTGFYFKQLIFYLQKNLSLSILSLAILIIGGMGVANSFLAGRTARLDEVGIAGAYNHRKYQTLVTVAKNYFAHFNPNFLFLNGDGNGRSQLPKYGPINLIYLPFLVAGLMYCLRERKKEYKLILFLLLIAPIPASITRESPHALRSISAVPFMALISSLGVFKLRSVFGNGLSAFAENHGTFRPVDECELSASADFAPPKKGEDTTSREAGRGASYIKAVVVVMLVIFLSYYQIFLSSYAKDTASDWQYGYKEFFDKYQPKFAEFDHVLVSDRYNQPYVFALFYLKYDPAKFRSEVYYNNSIRRKTSLVKSFDKFIFTNIDYHQIPKGKNLIFTHPTDKMDEIKWQEIILNPDGSIGGYVYEYEK